MAATARASPNRGPSSDLRALALACELLVVACGKGGSGVPVGSGTALADGGPAPVDLSPLAVEELRLWERAATGDDEDLATLARAVGHAGLEASADHAGRAETAVRAAAHAPGFGAARFLARVASGPDEARAALALEVLAEIGARPRRHVVDDDEEELAEGCATLARVATDAAAARRRRSGAVRAFRALPCGRAAFPPELDAR